MIEAAVDQDFFPEAFNKITGAGDVSGGAVKGYTHEFLLVAPWRPQDYLFLIAKNDGYPSVLLPPCRSLVRGDRIGIAIPIHEHVFPADAEFLVQIITNAFGPSLRKVDIIGFGTDAVGEAGKDHIGLRVRLQVPAELVELLRIVRFDVRFVEIEQDVIETIRSCIHIELAQQMLWPVIGGIEIDDL